MPATLTNQETLLLKAIVQPSVKKLEAIKQQNSRIAEAERQLETVTAALPSAQAKHTASLEAVALGIAALQNANQAADDTKLALDEVIQTQGVLVDQVRAQKATLKILENE